MIYIGFIDINVIKELLILTENHWFWSCFSIIVCFILTMWLFWGDGLNSTLWKWLPPFVLFRNYSDTLKKTIVIMIIVGTLLGTFGYLLGI